MREAIEHIKEQVSKEAQKMELINQHVSVSGTRYNLPLKDRDIEMVYYSANRENAPLLIGFHGGGFLFGGCAMDDCMWDMLSKELEVNVASIGYRKTPKYRYPCALEDAYDAYIYLKENSQKFGFDEMHISTFGSSAGANLATSLCILAKERGTLSFDYQILNYPFIDLATNPIDKGEGTLAAPIMMVFNELYCNTEETKLPTVSPLYATKQQLSGLPKTIIRMAENDNLRREGEIYTQHLREAGVEVIESLAEGMPHGYFEYGFGCAREFLPEEVIKLIDTGDIGREARNCLEFIKVNYVRC